MGLITTLTVTSLAVIGVSTSNGQIETQPYSFSDPLGYSEYNLLNETDEKSYNTEVKNIINQGKIMSCSNVTVLTQGMGGNYKDWFVMDSTGDIIIEKYGFPFSLSNNQIDNIYLFEDNNGFLVFKSLEIYNQDENELYFVTNDVTPKFNLNENIVLIYNGSIGAEASNFEAENNTNNHYYKTFEQALNTTLIELANQQYGYLPKINMIGHSRGGIINLLYANSYPEIVNNLISLGTPYLGSDWAEVYMYLLDISDKQEYIYYVDLLNKNNGYKYAYDYNLISNKLVNSYAIGFQQTGSYLVDTIGHITQTTNLINEIAESLAIASSGLVTMKQALSSLNWIKDFFLKNSTISYAMAYSLLEVNFKLEVLKFFDPNNDFYPKLEQLVTNLYTVLTKDIQDNVPDSHVHSDVAVNLNSQLGMERDYVPVYNFDKTEIITLGDQDNDFYYLSKYCGEPGNYWIGHNFETKNPIAIPKVINYLNEHNGFHNHLYNINSDSLSHSKVCRCGVVQHEYNNSVINVSYTDETTHTYDCPECDYTYKEKHYYAYQNLSETTHKKVCKACEYIVFENHLLNVYISAGPVHKSYCKCGLEGELADHTLVVSTGCCGYCGYKMINTTLPEDPPVLEPTPLPTSKEEDIVST